MLEYEELELEMLRLSSQTISARIGKVVVRELRKEGVILVSDLSSFLHSHIYEAFENLDFNRVKGILTRCPSLLR